MPTRNAALEWARDIASPTTGRSDCRSLRRRGTELALLAAFALSRLVARGVFGLRFDGAIFGYWQVLDLPLLRDDLLRSLVYLHSSAAALQPRARDRPEVGPRGSRAGGVRGLVPRPRMPRRSWECTLCSWSSGRPGRRGGRGPRPDSLHHLARLRELALLHAADGRARHLGAVWLARAARGRAGAAAAFAAAVAALSWIRATYQPVWVVAALALLLFAVRAAAPRVGRAPGVPHSSPSCWLSSSPRRTTFSWAPSRAAPGSA